MKRKLLFLTMLSALSIGAWADTSSIENPTQIQDIRTYTGTDKYVYSRADLKVYAYNNYNRYEEYGVYEEVTFVSPDYTEVEYIETDASHKTYLDTGYKIKANSRVMLDCKITHRDTTYVALFGGRKAWNNNSLAVFERFNNNDAGCYSISDGEHTEEKRGAGTFPTGSRVKVYTNSKNLYIYKDGGTTPSYTITNSIAPVDGLYSLYVFTVNNSDKPTNDYSYLKLYGLRIYEGDELVRDYVPVVNSAGKGGLRDKLSGGIILSPTDTDFNKSSTYETETAAANKGVSAYNGKLVVAGGIEYLWNGTSWVSQGCDITSDVDEYSGSADLVYDSGQSKYYVKNNLDEYEEYGLFGKTYTLELAGEGPKDYLFTTGNAYFNTGYIPKYNTKVRATAVVNPGTGEWQALYGCGYESDNWQRRFAFFSRADGRGRACIQLTSQNDVRCGAIFGRKAVYEVDGSTGVGTIYADDGTTVLETVTGTAQTDDENKNCQTPLYILADNNTLPDVETPNPRSYSNNTSIFRVEVYEDDTKIHDYIPYVYNGTAGLYDNIDGDMLSDFQSSKFLSPTGSGLTAGSVTAYEGKIVRLVPENHAYKYSNGEWTDKGAMSFTEISNTDYKDMGKWSTNTDHQSVFKDKITYANDVNTLDYTGITGWEPLSTTVTVETGKEFRFSFTYENTSTYDATGWEDGRLRVAVATSIGVATMDYFHGIDPNHLLTYKHGIEIPVTMDFTPKQTSMMMGIQFGALTDDTNYKFKFSNLKVEKYVYPTDYDVIDITRETEYSYYVKDYYLYNVGSGLWLQNNDRNPNNWTTHAELGDRGMNVGVSAISGGYQLNPYFGNNKSINSSNLYMDTSQSVTAWTISSVSGTDYVTIKSGDDFLGSDGTANKYLTKSSSLSGDNAYWKMYTADEYYDFRKTEMLTATQASPKDATWMVSGPTFAYQDERENNWNKSWTGGNNDLEGDTPDKGGINCNRVWESWNSSSLSMTQDLATLPAGEYRMSVQGFYKSSDGVKRPYFFAQNSTSGKVQRNLMLVSEGEHDNTNCAANATEGDDNGQYYASKCIYYGHYQNPWIYFVVGNDNESTTIGIKKEEYIASDWLIYDNFKLEYLGTGYELTLNENNATIDDFVGLATDITMTRTLKADKWNTFCVPFPMTSEQIAEQLGEGAEVKELTSATRSGENYTMTFSDAASIEAGKPYMVKVPSAVSTIELEDASGIAVNTTGTPSVTEDGVTFHGVYASGNAPEGSFIISDNVFYLVDSDVTLKAFRGYITVDGGADVKALDFIFDDDATLLKDLKDSKDLSDPKDSNVIYNLAGQRVDNSQFTTHNSQLKRGIYIVKQGSANANGKKILK